MKPSSIALGLALAAAAAPAAAQYNQPAPAPQQTASQPAATPAAKSNLKISRGASKAIGELQAAIKANDAANIPGKLAAAQAAAKTADDRYAIAALQYTAAKAANDSAGKAAAIEALIASGSDASNREMVPLTLELGATYKAANQLDRAASTFERVLASDPTNIEATVNLAETRNAQGRGGEAVSLLQKAIAARTATGQKVEETWYKRALSIGYKAKSPATLDLARSWVAAYPSPASWRDALAIYRNLGPDDDQSVLDILRLQRAAGAMSTDGDYHKYGFLAVSRGYPGEAKLLMEEAFAAKAVDPNKQLFRDIMSEATKRSAGDRTAMVEDARVALAGAEAKRALATGDAYFGYKDYAKAAELYRAALTKSGADKDLINLHLGMALARAGDKAGASAALSAVAGPRSELAKYWLLYVNTR